MRVRFFTLKIAILLLTVPILCVGQQPRKESLLNGLRVVMFQTPSSDRVWVRVRINSGSAFDPQGKEGLMQIVAANFFPTDAAREYFKDELGGSLDISTNYDYIEVDASAKPENLIPMLETLAGGIANTSIDKETTSRLRSEMIAKVKQLEQDPAYVADGAAGARLFGNFPYGRPIFGTEASLKKIDFADLIDARQRFLTADNATMVISGNFQPQKALQAVKRYFGAWQKADKRVPATFRQPDDPQPAVLTIKSPVAGQFAIRFAFRGTARSAADSASADVFARILEARLKARAPAEDAQNIFVRADSYLLPGWIVIGFSGSKNDVGSTNGKVEANELVKKALVDPITDAEFNAARAAAAAEWSKRPAEQFWLDADTYGTDPRIDRSAVEDLTMNKVRDFAAWAARQPMATVLVSSPK